jgi:hypothetical protein
MQCDRAGWRGYLAANVQQDISSLSDSGPDNVWQADNARYVVPRCPAPRPHRREKLRGADLVGEGDHVWFAFGLEYVDWHDGNVAGTAELWEGVN